MPTEVIKRGLTIGPPEHPLQLRPVAGMVDPGGCNFGCPMLSRSQMALPASGFQPAPRCSLGWSLHNEDEAMLCMLTPDLIQCWKAHPENIENLRETYDKDQEIQAAD
jgi:hypothetical protein